MPVTQRLLAVWWPLVGPLLNEVSAEAAPALALSGVPPGGPCSPGLLGLCAVAPARSGAALSSAPALPAHALCVLRLSVRRVVPHTTGQPHEPLAWSVTGLEGCGPATQAQAWPAPAGQPTVLWLLHASVLPALLGRPARAFRNQTLSAPDAAAVALALLAGPSGQGDPSCTRAWQAVDGFWPTLQSVGGVLAEADSVATARQALGWAPRQLQRWCDRFLGLPPEHVWRLLRLHRSTWALAAGASSASAEFQPGSGLAEHAAAAGFADQSHMGRDYRRLAQATPRQAAQADPALVASARLARLWLGATPPDGVSQRF